MKLTLEKGIVLTLILWSLSNQALYNISPILRNLTTIWKSLQYSDLERYEAALVSAKEIIEYVKQLPEGTNLYFAPKKYSDEAKGAVEWWHLNHLLRYFTYPKRILVIHESLYHSNYQEYLSLFVQGAKRYSDLEWVRDRNIKYVIYYRGGKLKMVPTSSKIEF